MFGCQQKSMGAIRGLCVAQALAGAWRCEPVPLGLSLAVLAEMTPLLLAAGAGGLGWWRVRHGELQASPAALPLRQAYRLHTLQAALHERELVAAVTLLRSAGVEPMLGKGWAAARLYPEPGLRPYGDIDLCVRPEQYAAATAALGGPGAPECPVDLHRGFPWLDDRRLEDLYARSRLVRLGEVEVRILGPEDHLRLLCLHMLGHGAVRPLWLCDIGAALESRPADFDWDRCLGGDRRRSDWVACALGLAHQLLGVRLDGNPLAGRAHRLPRWLVPTVLRQRGVSFRPRDLMGSYLRRTSFAALGGASGALAELRHHWPNGIEATVGVRGPFNEWPRLPFQLGACVVRTAQFLARLDNFTE
jgi:hypothetical protein